MKVGIIGTRGIPNRYGGFEQFAEHLALGLVERGHDVWVYNSSLHPYNENTWNGVEILHCFDPEDKIGTAGQFIYDLNCIRDARKRNFDVLLQLGYTSSSVWAWLLPKKPLVVTNMDGLEWKRSKYSNAVKGFLRRAERWAVMSSDILVADSLGIKDYLNQRYNVDSTFIPYGAEVFSNPNPTAIEEVGVTPFAYYMLVARMEPENNIETILEGYARSNNSTPFLVVGNVGNAFGREMRDRFSGTKGIQFIGAIYDSTLLDQLRHFSRLYFHGHSVGGTNPSLLEAMGSGALIAAHDNPFNRSVLVANAFYFKNAEDIERIITNLSEEEERGSRWRKENQSRIAEAYKWSSIIDQYEDLFERNLIKQS